MYSIYTNFFVFYSYRAAQVAMELKKLLKYWKAASEPNKPSCFGEQ